MGLTRNIFFTLQQHFQSYLQVPSRCSPIPTDQHPEKAIKEQIKQSDTNNRQTRKLQDLILFPQVLNLLYPIKENLLCPEGENRSKHSVALTRLPWVEL